MYNCLDCGEFFPEVDCGMERVGEYMGVPAYRTVDACPYCGSVNIEEANLCGICHERYIKSESDRCAKCEELICSALNQLVDSMEGCDEHGILECIGDWLEERA